MRIKEIEPQEYDAFYAPYFKVLGEVELLPELKARREKFLLALSDLETVDLGYRYAPGKWSIAELILHIIDSERIFQYRALRFGRGDTTPLPGFEQDIYVPNSNAANRTLLSLQAEFSQVREASISLFEHFPNAALLNRGFANGSEVSVRALGFMICGHQKHHELILQERYAK